MTKVNQKVLVTCTWIGLTTLFSVAACSSRNDLNIKASLARSEQLPTLEGDWKSECISPPKLESQWNRELFGSYKSMSIRALFYRKNSYWIWGRFFVSKDCDPKTQGNSYNAYGSYSIGNQEDGHHFYPIDFDMETQKPKFNIFQLTADGHLHFGKGDLLRETRPDEIDADVTFEKDGLAKIPQKCTLFNGSWWSGTDGHLRVNQKDCSQMELIYTTAEESSKPDPKGTHVLFKMNGEFYPDQDQEGTPMHRKAVYTEDGEAILVTQYYDHGGDTSLVDERYITFTKHPCNLWNPDGSNYLTWSDFTGSSSCSYWMRYPAQ